MAKINNQAIIQKLIDELKLYPVSEQVPTELAEKILPVYQVNTEVLEVSPKHANIVRHTSQDAGVGAATIYTVPTTGNFYLTNVSLFSKLYNSGFSDSGNVIVTIVIDGTTHNILRHFHKTHAAGDIVSAVETLNLQNPILLDKGSVIQSNPSDSSISCETTIVGYTSD